MFSDREMKDRTWIILFRCRPRQHTESMHNDGLTIDNVRKIQHFLLFIQNIKVECCSVAHLIITIKLGPIQKTGTMDNTACRQREGWLCPDSIPIAVL